MSRLPAESINASANISAPHRAYQESEESPALAKRETGCANPNPSCIQRDRDAVYESQGRCARAVFRKRGVSQARVTRRLRAALLEGREAAFVRRAR